MMFHHHLAKIFRFFPTTKQASQNDGIFRCYATPCEKGTYQLIKEPFLKRRPDHLPKTRWTSGFLRRATPGCCRKILRSFSWCNGTINWEGGTMSWMRLNYIPPVDVSVKHIPLETRPDLRENFDQQILRTLTSGWREQSRRPSGSWRSWSRDTPNITRSFTQVRPECALEIETAGRMAHLPRHHSSLVRKGATNPRIRLPVWLGLRMAMFEIPLLWISV